MGILTRSSGHSARMIDIVGLGPGDLNRVPSATLGLLLDPDRTVIVRTAHHPAAEELAALRGAVTFCDDLYDTAETFEATYVAIADRVLAAADEHDVVYAVPGSPNVGEFAVGQILKRSDATLHSSESFLDVVFRAVGVDPLDDGFQLLNGHRLPIVLSFEVPTVVAHLDSPTVLADIVALIDRTAPERFEITVLANTGASDQEIWIGPPASTPSRLAGYRTSIFVPAHSNGIVGAVGMMRRLRDECPWDRTQTHESLIRYLIEETFELVEALTGLIDGGPDGLGAYAEVEDELGDVLLQVLFHSVIAEDQGAFSINDVAHTLQTKMERRHPHVFGAIAADDAATVKRNWDDIKETERGGRTESLLDGITAMPALGRSMELGRRAAEVGFDWIEVDDVRSMVDTELTELDAASDPTERRHELGDVLFTVVNLARHLDIDPEAALQSAATRFDDRFRRMEQTSDLSTLDLEEMNAIWESAKRV